jgi:hypothetical protein
LVRRAEEARVCERFPLDFCFVLTVLRAICLTPWLMERIKRRPNARRLKAPDYRDYIELRLLLLLREFRAREPRLERLAFAADLTTLLRRIFDERLLRAMISSGEKGYT